MGRGRVAFLVFYRHHQLHVLHRRLLVAVAYGQRTAERLAGKHHLLLELQLDGHADRLCLRGIVEVGFHLVAGSHEVFTSWVDVVANITVGGSNIGGLTESILSGSTRMWLGILIAIDVFSHGYLVEHILKIHLVLALTLEDGVLEALDEGFRLFFRHRGRLVGLEVLVGDIFIIVEGADLLEERRTCVVVNAEPYLVAVVGEEDFSVADHLVVIPFRRFGECCQP